MALLRRAGVPRLAVAVLALGLVTATHGSARAARLDQLAPALSLPDGTGSPITLDALRGRVVVLDFWATWCAVCANALPKLDALVRQCDGKDLVVLAVNIDVDRERAARFLAEHVPGAVFRVVYDPRGRAMARYGAEGMPALFVIDRAGRIRHVVSGESTAGLDDLGSVVDRLLALE